MPATCMAAVYWAPPRRLPGTDGYNVRVIAGAPADGSGLKLLSAVAFGALRGCLEQGASPTVNTTALLARAVVEAHATQLHHV